MSPKHSGTHDTRHCCIMGFDLDALATYEYSLPVAVKPQRSFALTAQLLLSPTEGPPAFPSLRDVPLTKATFALVRDAVPKELADELETRVAKYLEYYQKRSTTEDAVWKQLLTNECNDQVGGLFRIRFPSLLEERMPGIELVVSEVYDMEDRSDGRAATHTRLRLKDYDSGYYEDRGWHLCDQWPWFGLEARECTAKEANSEARSLKIPLKAKERLWTDARRASEAATLEQACARLGLVAKGLPAWRLVLDVSGG